MAVHFSLFASWAREDDQGEAGNVFEESLIRTVLKEKHMRFGFVWLSLFVCTAANAQVWHEAPGASSGEIETGDGQALYGGFGLNASDGAAYNVYRKFAVVEEGTPLQEAANVPGNPSAVEWTGIHQVGNAPGVIAPGMFMGTSPSTSSYADQLLYLKPLVDETGGGNDENMRKQWDMRFGFLESPDDYVATQDPNSGGMDLWTGEWGTDGLSLQLLIGTNNELESDDWYTTTQSGLRLNAQDNVFADERGRDPIEIERSRYGTGDELEDVFANNEQAFAGVGYDDPIELSWNMELNSPGHADAVRAREVLFSLKVGNILHTTVFDPGSADDPVAPNFGDEDTAFSGGFFDWENSYPVFFLGTGGGTVDGVGQVGVFIPGDLNADGSVDGADEAIIVANMDGLDTTYSRGDFDQDGDTDADDLAAWQVAANPDPAAAIDAITNLDDRIAYVRDVVGTWMGDSNLDGEFNSSDFVTVFSAGEYEDELAGNSTWATGDWNGDKDFNSSDFVAAFSDGGYEKGPRAVAAVPEPSGMIMFLACLAALPVLRRR